MPVDHQGDAVQLSTAIDSPITILASPTLSYRFGFAFVFDVYNFQVAFFVHQMIPILLLGYKISKFPFRLHSFLHKYFLTTLICSKIVETCCYTFCNKIKKLILLQFAVAECI